MNPGHAWITWAPLAHLFSSEDISSQSITALPPRVGKNWQFGPGDGRFYSRSLSPVRRRQAGGPCRRPLPAANLSHRARARARHRSSTLLDERVLDVTMRRPYTPRPTTHSEAAAVALAVAFDGRMKPPLRGSLRSRLAPGELLRDPVFHALRNLIYKYR